MILQICCLVKIKEDNLTNENYKFKCKNSEDKFNFSH